MTSILITGANRGLGLNIIMQLLKNDDPPAVIIATCRDPDSADELQSLAADNPSIRILKLEVTDYDSFDSFAEEVETIVGDSGLNVLLNNAGILPNPLSFENSSPEEYINVYKVNVVGPVFLTMALLPLVKRAADNNADKPMGFNRAAIINMSSLLGSIAQATEANPGLYCSYRETKAALNIFTVTLLCTLADSGIIVVPLHPGWVKTELGGSDAPMEIDDSVSGIVEVMYNLEESQNGQFLQWDGQIVPW